MTPKLELAAITDETGQPQRVLLGRTDLNNNPLTQPLLNSLRGMETLDGVGILLDEQGRVLFHPSRDLLLTFYPLDHRGAEENFYTVPAPGGTRNLVYYQPVPGRAWAVRTCSRYSHMSAALASVGARPGRVSAHQRR